MLYKLLNFQLICFLDECYHILCDNLNESFIPSNAYFNSYWFKRIISHELKRYYLEQFHISKTNTMRSCFRVNRPERANYITQRILYRKKDKNGRNISKNIKI